MSKKLEVKHADSEPKPGKARPREVKDGGKTGVNVGGRHVTSQPSDKTRDPHGVEMKDAKVALFTRGGDHGPDRPGMSDRGWNPNDNSELESETH